jgi:hypothetical protein
MATRMAAQDFGSTLVQRGVPAPRGDAPIGFLGRSRRAFGDARD